MDKLLIDENNVIRGYIFKFEGHGAFDPNGIIPDLTDEQIKAHNLALAKLEVELALKEGKATFYYFKKYAGDKLYPGIYTEHVGTWDGSYKWPAISKESWHNMAGKNGRKDLWFNIEDQKWWGKRIGSCDLVRAKRVKR